MFNPLVPLLTSIQDRTRRLSIQTQQGFVLITTMLLLSLGLALFAAYFLVTNTEIASVRYSKNSASGFYSAEAGLNVRAEDVRAVFVGFNRPAGTSPNATNACVSTNLGSGDYQCKTYAFNGKNVKSYVVEDPTNPVILTIPPGERYQNLNAQEYLYTAKSISTNVQSNVESDLELKFKSRLVPLFQFAAFYNKDLEILPGPAMSLAGPVHTNGDLYLYGQTSLAIAGQVTAAGDIYRGSKDARVPSCTNAPVTVLDPVNPRTLITTCPSRTKVLTSHVTPFNNMIQFRVQAVTVPDVGIFSPATGSIYWDRADIRLVLPVNAADTPTGSVEVRKTDDTVDAVASASLNACAGLVAGKAVGTALIRNFRETGTGPAVNIRLLDVDVVAVLNCLKNTNWFGTGKLLSETSDGGLVWHLTVKGPNSSALPNHYGVRLRNAQQLRSTVAGAPLLKGLTVVSDQAAYTMGNYNSQNKIPAAVMADSLNILSTAWSDGNSALAIGSRVASSTTINSAFLAGTDTTRNLEGAAGQGAAYPAQYCGGLENYPRFHENWSGRVLTYRGSFVSLGNATHVNGTWGNQSYSPPNRDWNYDTSFNNAANLPPLTPRFVYLRQELFERDFQQN